MNEYPSLTALAYFAGLIENYLLREEFYLKMKEANKW